MRMLLATLAFLLLMAAPTALLAGETTTNQPVTFEKDIGPLFQKACVACHGEQKAKGGVRLDTQKQALQSGKGGPVVVPGDSARSKLVRVLTKRGKGGGYAHPPRQPLSEDQLTLIRSWINQGAK